MDNASASDADFLDRWMPDPRWAASYERLIPATPENALAAAKRLRAGDVPVTRALVALRGIPATLSARQPSALEAGTSLVDAMTHRGYSVVADDATRLVLMGIGQPWRLAAGQHIAVEGQGAPFSRPGFVVVLTAFWTLPHRNGCRLLTETRVHPTSAGAARAFAWYWTVIGPFSGLIRREMLRAADARAARVRPAA